MKRSVFGRFRSFERNLKQTMASCLKSKRVRFSDVYCRPKLLLACCRNKNVSITNTDTAGASQLKQESVRFLIQRSKVNLQGGSFLLCGSAFVEISQNIFYKCATSISLINNPVEYIKEDWNRSGSLLSIEWKGYTAQINWSFDAHALKMDACIHVNVIYSTTQLYNPN